MTYRIATLVGSLRKDSYNRTLAEALIRLAPNDFSFFEIEIGTLPLYNQDDDDNQAEAVRQMKDAAKGSDGVFIVTPEYNRSVPGVLKNALDHGSRPYGDNSWSGLPTGIVGVSPGNIGTAIAQSHLRTTLAFLDMPTLGQPEMFIQWKDGLVKDDGTFAEDSKDFFQTWMDTFTNFVRQTAGKA